MRQETSHAPALHCSLIRLQEDGGCAWFTKFNGKMEDGEQISMNEIAEPASPPPADEACQKLAKKDNFLKLIKIADVSSAATELDLENTIVEDSYDVARLVDEITQDFIDDLVAALMRHIRVGSPEVEGKIGIGRGASLLRLSSVIATSVMFRQ